MIPIKSPRDIAIMRESGKIAAEVLTELEAWVRPGVTTAELDAKAYDTILRARAKPAFLGYRGTYPATLCTSLNDEVVHGIPSTKRVLKDGDLLSVDVGVHYKGYYGDNARTFVIGSNDEAERLARATHECLLKGIAALGPYVRLGAVSNAIQRHAEANGFSVVRDLVGHGIGRRLHEEPNVPNFGSINEGPILRPGMVLAVEPMINAGTYEVVTLQDGWTVVTVDGKPSAHSEYTVAILSDGIEILTKWGSEFPYSSSELRVPSFELPNIGFVPTRDSKLATRNL